MPELKLLLNSKRILFSLLLLFGFMGLDLLLGTILIPYISPTSGIRKLDPYYNHGFVSNSKGIEGYGSLKPMYYINSLGLKDSKIRNVPIESSKYRILFLGDSFTEGIGYPWDSGFCGYLQNYLDSSKIEILNAGVASYSPKLEYLKLDYLINQKKLKVNEVYCFLDNSDVSDELVYQDFEPQLPDFKNKVYYGIGIFLKRHSLIFNVYHLLRIQKYLSENNLSDESIGTYWLKSSNNFNIATDKQFERFRGSWIEMLDKPVTQKALNLTEANIIKIKQLCDSIRVPFYLCIYPNSGYLLINRDVDGKMASSISKKYVEVWQNFAARNGIDFINLFPLFTSDNHDQALINRMQYYIPGDSHWNSEGHKKVADSLFILINSNTQAIKAP